MPKRYDSSQNIHVCGLDLREVVIALHENAKVSEVSKVYCGPRSCEIMHWNSGRDSTTTSTLNFPYEPPVDFSYNEASELFQHNWRPGCPGGKMSVDYIGPLPLKIEFSGYYKSPFGHSANTVFVGKYDDHHHPSVPRAATVIADLHRQQGEQNFHEQMIGLLGSF